MANKTTKQNDSAPVDETPAPLTAELQRALDDNTALQAKLDEVLTKLSVFEADNAKMDECWRKSREHNGMLRSELGAAKATIATLTHERNEALDNVDRLMEVRHTAPVPRGLIGVTTDRVENLPTIDQFPAHATMIQPGVAPGVPESQDQRDVREHIERKRLGGYAAGNVVGDEGTKPQE